MDMTDTKAGLCDQFPSYHNSDLFSDFTIKCGEIKWKVHKFVLAVHSDVLKKCCHGTFKESSEGVLDLSEHEEIHVESLVHYLYHFSYDYVLPNANPDKHLGEGSFHIDMAIIADKYFITGLNALANAKFADDIAPFVQDDETLAPLATKAFEVPQATSLARELLVNSIVRNRTLGDNPRGSVASAMRDNGEFAVDVALALQSSIPDTRLSIEQIMRSLEAADHARRVT
ncbi:unnamed protein product [Zymoseptoria tritici ST99CH_1A5]|uniref:BTB domain-containing protein n=1 Tax=Zymoseptoria tritici ST99CH_1A5 TaxID=1276529 RepID=A0A1Y6LQ69_ZYMTR|nr:unnamed protein product [Zymoseptoria tritici ST99CH_1A5]